jgi:N-acetylmuramoyl-L-alanine amidase
MNWFTRIFDDFTAELEREHSIKYLRPLMTITADHWLEAAIRKPITGGNLMDTRRFLVIHDTSGWSAISSIEGWKDNNDGVLAHVVIDRDGTIYQCRPFNRTCGHAGPPGKSAWRDPKTGTLYDGLNSCAIGIELANAADMARSPDVYPSYNMGALAFQPIPRLQARHKNGGLMKGWEIYSQPQLAACEAVSKALVARYDLDDVIGHEDCSPDRKVDPGPAYPMQVLRNACGFNSPLPKLRR